MENGQESVGNSEKNEQIERRQAIQELQNVINGLVESGKEKGFWDERAFTVIIRSPDIPDLAWVRKNFEPMKEPTYLGIHWEYEVTIRYPKEEVDEDRYIEYYVTAEKGDLIKVEADDYYNLEDNESNEAIRKAFHETGDVKDMIAALDESIRIDEQLRKNFQTEMTMGLNGVPASLSEIKWLNGVLRNTEIISSKER